MAASEEGVQRHHPPTLTQDEQIRKKAEAFIARVREHNDVTLSSGSIDTGKGDPYYDALDPVTLKYMVDHQMIIELKERELSSAYSDSAKHNDLRNQNSVKPDGHYTFPVYVIPGVGEDKVTSQMLGPRDKNGSHDIIFVTEGAHIYDADYYRDYLMWNDKQILSDSDVVTSHHYQPQTDAERVRYKELLSNVSEQAKTQDIVSPSILITKTANAEIGSLQSREGKEYIYIPEQQLKAALASDAQMQKLKESIDQQEKQIKDHANSPEAIVATRTSAMRINDEESKFFAYFPVLDDTKLVLPLHGEDLATVSDAALKDMAVRGDLVEVKKNNLIPAATADPLFQTKDAQGNDLPIYTVPDTPEYSRPRALLLKTKEGNPYLLINEGYHQWDEAYVRDHVLRTQESINNDSSYSKADDAVIKIKETQTDGAAIERRHLEIQKFIAHTSEEMGIDNPPFFIDGSKGASIAYAAQTREGNSYIAASKATYLKALSSDEEMKKFEAVAGHELAHIKDNDVSPAGIVRSRNWSLNRQAELKADLMGSGPLGDHDPKAMAEFLEDQIRVALPLYLAAHPGSKISDGALTDQEINTISAWAAIHTTMRDHPADAARIAALREEAILMEEYEKTHQVVTHEARVAESVWVVDKVMKDMNDQQRLGVDGTPSPAAAAPMTTLTSSTSENRQEAVIEQINFNKYGPVGFPGVQSIKEVNVQEAHNSAPKNTPITAAPLTTGLTV